MSPRDTRFLVRWRGPRLHQVRERQRSFTHTEEAILYVGTEYISLKQTDMDYLVRVFQVLQYKIARLHNRFVGRLVICDVVLNCGALYRTDDSLRYIPRLASRV